MIAVVPPDMQFEVDELERSKIAALYRSRDVIAAAPVMPIALIRPFESKKPSNATEQGTAWGIKAVKADVSPYSGDGIVVAVLDTGIDARHDAFAGVEIIKKDFTGEGNGDRDGHGTHCAGIIFGRDVNRTRIGVARGVKKALAGKVLGEKSGSSESICSAVYWAIENEANIISMSLGIDFPGYVETLVRQNGLPVELATSKALEGYRANVLLFEKLASFIKARAGILLATVVVAAAGNESRRDVDPDWEIAVSPPAVAEGIISVSALGRDQPGLTVAPFSNTGADIAAPGVDVVSAKAGGGLTALSGTSMAAPCVAGVAALWAEKLKGEGRLNEAFLISRIIGSATDKGLGKGFDPLDIGAGLVQAPPT